MAGVGVGGIGVAVARWVGLGVFVGFFFRGLRVGFLVGRGLRVGFFLTTFLVGVLVGAVVAVAGARVGV